MAVHVTHLRIDGDRTDHCARSVGLGRWIVSFLPGRTVDRAEAIGAIAIADAVAELADMAGPLGLTVCEAVGLAQMLPRRLDRERPQSEATSAGGSRA